MADRRQPTVKAGSGPRPGCVQQRLFASIRGAVPRRCGGPGAKPGTVDSRRKELRPSLRLKGVVMSLTAALGLAACGNSTSTSGPVNGGTLVYALDADAQTLNPFEAGDVPSVRAFQFMFPNLYQADKNLNIPPDLADGLPTISSDHLTWTVKIRTGAKWSDGSAITADDVVKTYQIQADANLD